MRIPVLNIFLFAVAATLSAEPSHSVAEAIIFSPVRPASAADAEIARCQQLTRASDASAASFERLGWAFVAKARRTLDAGCYVLAEKTADVMDARFGPTDAAALLRGHAFHNLHRFHAAEAIARDLVARRGAPDDFALLSDALMEQGRLDDAVAALQQMVDLKPGVEAYSRIAHLRWLKGDLPGDVAALQAARASAAPDDAETLAWIEVRLSLLTLETNAAPRALALAESALHRLPDYPPALLARGRALLALGQTAAALGALERAAHFNPLPEYQWWLADALHAAGRDAAAAKVETSLKRRGVVTDPRTLSLFLATRHKDAAAAVELARAELANRADVFTQDALAWALAANGDIAGAQVALQHALAEHTQDARLFWHAGEITLAAGHPDAAAAFFARALPLAATLTPGERTALTHRVASLASATAAQPLCPKTGNLTCSSHP